MASPVPTAVVRQASTALKLSNGIVCIYKPQGWGLRRIIKEFRHKLAADLNSLDPPPRAQRVEIRRVNASDKESLLPLENEEVLSSIDDGQKTIEVVKGLSYADHPLVAGERYIPEDFKLIATNKVLKNASGVYLLGVNGGIKDAHRIHHSRWLKTYQISGRFGIATNTFFHTGKVLDKSTYKSIKRSMLDRFLVATQSSHQRLSFQAAGVPLNSERAYEIASQGLVRPAETSTSIVYAIKCVDFSLPDFTLEVKAINEDENYLMVLIHEIGLKLHSVATCTKLRCTNVGPFGLEDALLFKHWDLGNVLDNLKNSRTKLEKFNLYERDSWVTTAY